MIVVHKFDKQVKHRRSQVFAATGTHSCCVLPIKKHNRQSIVVLLGSEKTHSENHTHMMHTATHRQRLQFQTHTKHSLQPHTEMQPGRSTLQSHQARSVYAGTDLSSSYLKSTMQGESHHLTISSARTQGIGNNNTRLGEAIDPPMTIALQ
jgi:hypothetical protein